MQDKENVQPLMVSIRCITYNHEPYIRECLEGFVMQKTNFRFEAIVHDDASTDGTAAIIREYAEKYPDIIKPIFETENQYSKHDGSLGRIMDAHLHGKYVAMCEGDDYWIDPLKLQKQVDYMEAHPECSMCHTSYKYYFDAEKRYLLSNDVNINPNFKKISLEDVLEGYRIRTLTLMAKKDDLLKIKEMDPFAFNSNFMMGDTQTWYYLRKLGEFHFFSDITSIYRVHIGSASNLKYRGAARFAVSCAELRYYLCCKDHLNPQYCVMIKQRLSKALSLYRCFDPSYKSLIDDTQVKSRKINIVIYRQIRILIYRLGYDTKNRLNYILRFLKAYNW